MSRTCAFTQSGRLGVVLLVGRLARPSASDKADIEIRELAVGNGLTILKGISLPEPFLAFTIVMRTWASPA